MVTVRKKKIMFNILGMTVIILFLIFLFAPIFWGVITSFKGLLNYIEDKLGFPETWVFDNYVNAFNNFYVLVNTSHGPKNIYIEEMVLNTLLYAFGCSFSSAFVRLITAYALFRYKQYKLSKIIFATIIIALFVPLFGSTASELALIRQLGLYDSIPAMWLLRANFLGIFVMLFYAGFAGVPKDLMDAAEVDGASRFQLMFKVMIPLIKGLISLCILQDFIQYWNNYTIPLLYLPSHPTIGLGLFYFNQSSNNAIAGTPAKLAGALIVAAPIILLLALFGNRLMMQITLTDGIKG